MGITHTITNTKNAKKKTGKTPLLINGLFLSYPYSGIGYHTLFLLASHNETHSPFIVHIAAKNHPEELCHLPKHSFFPLLFPSSFVKRVISEQIFIPLYWVYLGFPKVYHPYPCASLCIPKRFQTSCVHDVIPYSDARYTEKTGTKIRLWYEKTLCRFKSRIISVSETSAGAIRKMFALSYTPAVIGNGYLPQIVTQHLKNASGNDIHILYFGGYDIRKNVPFLISALNTAAAHSNKKIHLHLVGKPDKREEQAINKVYGLHIHKHGFVSNQSLISLIMQSDAVISLSQDEWFNVPLLLWAVSKKMLICSDIAIHQEMYPRLYKISIDNAEKSGKQIAEGLEKQRFYLSKEDTNSLIRTYDFWNIWKKIYDIIK